MLPGLSGLEVCRALRADAATAQLPIIMVTARAEETDRIIGPRDRRRRLHLQAVQPERAGRAHPGADAPFTTARAEEPTLASDRSSMDLSRHTVSDDGPRSEAHRQGIPAAAYLLQHRGRVLSRDLLLGDVWGYRYTGGTRTVDVHVRRLREKLPSSSTRSSP